MSKLQLINAKKMEKLLLNLGFIKTRQKGSHAFYKHNDGRTTTVPFHISKDLARPLIREILNEINISIDEYNDQLKKL
jgi:predicted RNA binding protein YcfA (HicA-like mRNA interferase family)